IPNGATVERALPDVFGSAGENTLNLHNNDFTTVSRMVAALNNAFGDGVARAVDGVTVSVQAPTDPGARIGLLARIENLELSPGSAPAMVVVNSRTGTVVIGQQVRVGAAAISHGSLTVTIQEGTAVSQPNALAGGQTVVAPQSTETASADGSR
ncbi:flagellar basal body P-ring protein FlgI, partial [Xanthomonas citri pv. citri]